MTPSADAQPGEQWIETGGIRPFISPLERVYVWWCCDALPEKEPAMRASSIDSSNGWDAVRAYRLASGQSNAPTNRQIIAQAYAALTPAAPVWRPCTERPSQIGEYLRRCSHTYKEYKQSWSGYGWSGCNEGHWLDPAPGHEEQVNAAQDGVLEKRSGLERQRSDTRPIIGDDTVSAAAPTIEQDRQAWRSWFGAYSEPVKPFGSRG